ncbi:hypothetical protein [Nannocystis pusilla]|uniref:hypothetical protein n=1 Tax=Nannocystis pusilla TaxID=889268 RepID=UPI003BF21F20
MLAEFADSPDVEWWQVERLMFEHFPDKPYGPKEAAEHRDALAAFLARPRWHSASAHAFVADMHFEALRDDPDTPAEVLLAAVEAMLVHPRSDLRKPYGPGVLALAELTPYVERAEALAREGLMAIETAAVRRLAAGVPREVVDAERDELLGVVHDALGAALLAGGRLDEAEAELRAAKTLGAPSPENLAHFAVLADRRGDRKAAEAMLIECVETPYCLDGRAAASRGAWPGGWCRLAQKPTCAAARSPGRLENSSRFRREFGSFRDVSP